MTNDQPFSEEISFISITLFDCRIHTTNLCTFHRTKDLHYGSEVGREERQSE